MKRLLISDTFKHAVCLLLILVLGVVAIRDLFKSGFYESHDGIIHVMRLAHFDAAFREGQFPVRWLPSWMAGYGSPVFLYIWPLPYYLGSVLHGFGLTFETAVQFLLGSGFLLSGIFCYVFIFSLFDDRLAALAGGVFYMWAPYRFTNIFIRGALGEATAMLFLPLLLWLVVSVYRKKLGFRFLGLSFAWALLILTHNIMAVVFSLIVFVFALSLSLYKKKFFPFAQVVLAFLMSLGLSTVYWLPAVLESKLVKLEDYLRYSYSIHFVPLQTLINSPWRYAYAWPQAQEYSMSFQVGLIHLGLVVFAVLLLLIRLVFKKGVNQCKKMVSVWLFFLLVGIVTLVIMMPFTGKWLFLHLPFLSVLNYPWRLLAVLTFSLSIMAACTVLGLPRQRSLLVIGLLVLVIGYSWNFARIIGTAFTRSDNSYKQMVRTNVGFLPDAEFLPPNVVYHELLEKRGSATQYSFFETTEPNVSIITFPRHQLTYTAEVTTTKPITILANAFYFPGWKLWIDGNLRPIVSDTQGLLTFQVPTGTHEIKLAFTDTPIRALANSISLISLTIWGVLIILQIRQKNQVIKV